MTPNVRPIVVGNWKMNADLPSLSMIDEIVAESMEDVSEALDVCLCLPATLLSAAR